MLNLPPVRPQGHPALSMQYPEAFTGVKAKFPMPSTIDDICRELRLLQKTIQFVYAILVRGIYLLIQFIIKCNGNTLPFFGDRGCFFRIKTGI